MEKVKRAFYEIWGDMEAQNRTLKYIIFGQIILLILALLFLLFLASEPPVVIRVNEVGRAETIQSLRINNKVTELEVKEFTKDFIRSFRAFSPFSLDEDLARAFNSMTGRFQKIAETTLLASELLKEVKAKQVAVKVEVKEVTIQKETDAILEARALGVRRVINLNNENQFSESLFQAELAIKKVSRNTNAYGLLIEDYREISLKDIKGGINE